MLLPKTDIMLCKRVTDFDQAYISDNFSVDRPEGYGLEVYLKNDALADECSGKARTYLVVDRKTEEIVAYFSLKAGFTSSDEHLNGFFRKTFNSKPGIELSNFAVNSKYLKKHPGRRGVGRYVFRMFILPLASITAKLIGVDVLYIFALPFDDLINLYKNRYGFQRAGMIAEAKIHRRIRPAYDDQCIYMFQKI